jgi:hypothetical protein
MCVSDFIFRSGISQLQEQIIHVALRQPYMPEYIPKPFLALEEQLRVQSTSTPILLWQQFAEYGFS